MCWWHWPDRGQDLPNGPTFSSSATFFSSVVNEAALGPRRGQPRKILTRVVAQGILNAGAGTGPPANAGQPHHFGRAIFQAVGTIGITLAPLAPGWHLTVDGTAHSARFALVAAVSAAHSRHVKGAGSRGHFRRYYYNNQNICIWTVVKCVTYIGSASWLSMSRQWRRRYRFPMPHNEPLVIQSDHEPLGTDLAKAKQDKLSSQIVERQCLCNYLYLPTLLSDRIVKFS